MIWFDLTDSSGVEQENQTDVQRMHLSSEMTDTGRVELKCTKRKSEPWQWQSHLTGSCGLRQSVRNTHTHIHWHTCNFTPASFFYSFFTSHEHWNQSTSPSCFSEKWGAFQTNDWKRAAYFHHRWHLMFPIYSDFLPQYFCLNYIWTFFNQL